MHGLFLSDELVRGVQRLLIMQKGKRLSPCSDHRDCFHCVYTWDAKANKRAEPMSAGVSKAFSLVQLVPPWANNTNNDTKAQSDKKAHTNDPYWNFHYLHSHTSKETRNKQVLFYLHCILLKLFIKHSRLGVLPVITSLVNTGSRLTSELLF